MQLPEPGTREEAVELSDRLTRSVSGKKPQASFGLTPEEPAGRTILFHRPGTDVGDEWFPPGST